MSKYILEINSGVPILRGIDAKEYWHFGVDPKGLTAYTDGSLDNYTVASSMPGSGDQVLLPTSVMSEVLETGKIIFDGLTFVDTGYVTDFNGTGSPYTTAATSYSPLIVGDYPEGTSNTTNKMGFDHSLVQTVSETAFSALSPPISAFGSTAKFEIANGYLTLTEVDSNANPSMGDITNAMAGTLVAEYTDVSGTDQVVYVQYQHTDGQTYLIWVEETADGTIGTTAMNAPVQNVSGNESAFFVSNATVSTYSATNSTTNAMVSGSEPSLAITPNSDAAVLEAANLVYSAMSAASVSMSEFDPSQSNSAMSHLAEVLPSADFYFGLTYASASSSEPNTNVVPYGGSNTDMRIWVADSLQGVHDAIAASANGGYTPRIADFGIYRTSTNGGSGTASTVAGVVSEFESITDAAGWANLETLDELVNIASLDVNTLLSDLGVSTASNASSMQPIKINTDYVKKLAVTADTDDTTTTAVLNAFDTTDSAHSNMWGDSTSLLIDVSYATTGLDLSSLSYHIHNIEIKNSIAASGVLDLSDFDFDHDQIIDLTNGSFTLDRSTGTIGLPQSMEITSGATLEVTQDFANASQFKIINNGTLKLTGTNDTGETITGTDGDDHIEGGKGNDVLNGLGGDNTYIFNTDGTSDGDGDDVIIGFNTGDTIEITDGSTTFTKSSETGESGYATWAAAKGTTYFEHADGSIEYAGGTISFADPVGRITADESKFEIIELKDERAGDIITYGVRVKESYDDNEYAAMDFGISWVNSEFKFIENSLILGTEADAWSNYVVVSNPANPNHQYSRPADNQLYFQVARNANGDGSITPIKFSNQQMMVPEGFTAAADGSVTTGADATEVTATVLNGAVTLSGAGAAGLDAAGITSVMTQVLTTDLAANGNAGAVDKIYVTRYDAGQNKTYIYSGEETGPDTGTLTSVTVQEAGFQTVSADYVAKFSMLRTDTTQSINQIGMDISNDTTVVMQNGNQVLVSSVPNSEVATFDYTTDQVSVQVKDALGTSTTPTKFYYSSDTVSDGLSIVPVMQVGDLVKYNVVMNVASPTVKFSSSGDVPILSQLFVTGAEIYSDSVKKIGTADQNQDGWFDVSTGANLTAKAGATALTLTTPAETQFDYLTTLKGATTASDAGNITTSLEFTNDTASEGFYSAVGTALSSPANTVPAVSKFALAEFWAKVDSDGINYAFRNYTGDDSTNGTSVAYGSDISIKSADITGGSKTFTVNDGSDIAVIGDTVYENPFSNYRAHTGADALLALQVSVDDPAARDFSAASYLAADFDKDGTIDAADAYDILVTSAYLEPTALPGYTAGSGAELSTPDWIFVEHDDYAGGDMIDVQTSGGDHQISYDRYFDKFIGETSSFEVTAVLSGDVDHSYTVVPDAESPVLADYGTFIGLSNTATDDTKPSAQTMTQATTAGTPPAGGAGNTIAGTSSATSLSSSEVSANGGIPVTSTQAATLAGEGYAQGSSTTTAAANLKKFIGVQDAASSDFSDVLSIINAAVDVPANTTAGDSASYILVSNSTDTRIYSFLDDATENSTIEASELMHIWTVTGLSDLSTIDISDFTIV